MLDTQFLILHTAKAQTLLAQRGYTAPLEPLVHALLELKALKAQLETIRAELNRGQGTAQMKTEQKRLVEAIAQQETATGAELLRLPNLPHELTPVGEGAEQNIEVLRHPGPEPVAPGVIHADFANELDLFPEKAAQLTGARFHVFGPKAALLARKLLNYAMDFYAQHYGYQEHWVPQIVHQDMLQGTGQWPKFAEELFALNTPQPWYLIPTGEVPLTNLYANTTLRGQDLPTGQKAVRLMTTTACFRQEAGAAGRDTRGLLRQHQFDKLELVHVCGPQAAHDELLAMLGAVRALLDTLPLGYRVVELCTGDMGFAGHRAFDVEVWFPGAKAWREVATLTWCGDFQARRMQTRYKTQEGTKTFAHTLNGTGLAVGRIMAALFETHFDPATKTLRLPDALLTQLGMIKT